MFLNDLRYAVRTLAKAPGFAAAVIITLGLGIGANTAIFSVVRGVLLKPLPHRNGDRLVYLRQSVNGPGGDNIVFSVPEINDIRTGAKSFASIAEYSGMTYTLRDAGDPMRINVGLVTGNYFSTMGLSQILGRLLNDGDDGTTVPPVMVLTEQYWRSHFAADPSVIGRKVTVDGKPVEIVGVVQAAPYFPARMDALMNMVISPHHTSALMVQGRTHRMTEMIARLTPAATIEGARSEVAAIRARVQRDYPEAYDPNSGYRVTVIPFKEVLGEKAQATLWLLMASAAFVMIISCANVANLTLMRGIRREHELVVRAALGAGTARLRQLLLAENLVLAFAGAVLGVLIANASLPLLVSLAQRYSERSSEIHLDSAVLGFTMLLAVAVAILLAFAPSTGKEGALGSIITSGSTRSSGGVKRQRLQRAFVVTQVAVSVMLLTGAGLLTRTIQQLAEVKDGLKSQNVLTMEVPLAMGERTDAAARQLYDRMRLELAAIPGVSEVGVGSVMPLRTTNFQLDVKAEGRPLASGEAQPRAEMRTADAGYFRASGIPLVAGREFETTDRDSSQKVVIINQTLAKMFFGDRDPINQRIAWTGDVLRFIGVSGDWRTVVGVVGDTKDGGLDAEARNVVFEPFTQEQVFQGGGIVISAAAPPTSLIPAATRIVRSIAPREPIENVKTVGDIRGESLTPRKLNAELVSSFSILAVVIAAVGIAGVLAFSVNARTNEIGIRMSLGADSASVQRMILWEGGVILLAGLAIGLGGSVFATRLLQGMLYGVAAEDPLTLAGVAVVMGVVGVAACWLPARRAAAIDPAITMRGQ